MAFNIQPRVATLGVAIVVSLALSLLAAGLYAATASAEVRVYCQKLVPALTPCDETVVYQHVQQNVAQYTGAGTVSVCQKLTVGGVNRNRTCGNNYTSSGIANWGNLRAHVGNDSVWAHTINGIATGTN